MVYRRKALQQEVSTGITARRSLSADSSPQAGFNFFCLREERCCIVDGVLREVSSQSLPVLTLGLHHSKSIDVLQKLRSSCLVVAREHVRPYCATVYSWLSDQAPQESRVADAPASAARHLAPRHGSMDTLRGW
jgi:hypothetical protein